MSFGARSHAPETDQESFSLKGLENHKLSPYDDLMCRGEQLTARAPRSAGGPDKPKGSDNLSGEESGDVVAALQATSSRGDATPGPPQDGHQEEPSQGDASHAGQDATSPKNDDGGSTPVLAMGLGEEQPDSTPANRGHHHHHKLTSPEPAGPLMRWSEEDRAEIEEHREALWEVAERFADDVSRYIEAVPEFTEMMNRSSSTERHRQLMLEHLDVMLRGDPRSEDFQTRSRRLGRTHIAMGVPPSAYVLLYNRWFAAAHHMEDEGRELPDMDVIRRLWQWDLSTSLDAYHEGLLSSWNTERGRLEETVTQFRRLASTDPLTGLPNRSALQDLVQQHISHHGGSAHLILFDLDHFKRLNDRLGHPSGDRALSVVGKALASSVRRSDAVSRIGGDEFCLWIAGSQSDQDVVDQLRRLVSGLPLANLGIGISAGAAKFPDHGTDFATLYSAADKALYAAKRDGRGALCISGTSASYHWKPKPGG